MSIGSHIFPIQADFIVSLGNACRPAAYLRKFNLRFSANPLDWMMEYSLLDVVDLIQNDFRDFFAEKIELEDWQGPHREIKDKRNGMIALHSFPRDVDIDVFYNTVFYPTMLNRYKRMMEFIRTSKNILFIANRQENLEDIDTFCTKIDNIFKNRWSIRPSITFLNIRDSAGEYSIERQIATNVMLVEYCFKDEHPNGTTPENLDFYLGNPEKWEMLMRQLSLTDTFRSNHLERTDIQDDKTCK